MMSKIKGMLINVDKQRFIKSLTFITYVRFIKFNEVYSGMVGDEMQITKIIEEIKTALQLRESPATKLLIKDIEFKLGEELVFYRSEGREIRHQLIRILENDDIIVGIIKTKDWTNYEIAEEYIEFIQVAIQFKRFVDKEIYKKAKQYEERKVVIKHDIKTKITLEDVMKMDKVSFAKVYGIVRDLEFFKKWEVLKALGFDSKKLEELYKKLF